LQNLQSRVSYDPLNQHPRIISQTIAVLIGTTTMPLGVVVVPLTEDTETNGRLMPKSRSGRIIPKYARLPMCLGIGLKPLFPEEKKGSFDQ